jgi:3-oxoisoapionate kinase
MIELLWRVNMNNRLLLAFYGDDFTGSTDAMEALTIHGFKTVLFLEAPDEKMLERFEDVQCIGVAGTSRAKNAAGMKEELTPVFEKLKEINPYFVHYKTCSTFDSAPDVGSIGFASDLARNYFSNRPYPLLVAVPQLGRYTVFGNHFSRMDKTVYRLDRHPIMSKHPVTPMNESDLRLHLSKQTAQEINLISLSDLEGGKSYVLNLLNNLNGIVLFDAFNENHLETIASSLWETRNEESQFLVGSSGVEYALAEKWKKDGLNNAISPTKNTKKTDRILVVSGSVSEITSKQMKDAINKGFYAEQIPYQYFGKNEVPTEYLDRVSQLIDDKKKVILYTSDGPGDKAVVQTRIHMEGLGVSSHNIGETIGRDLGKWTKEIVRKAKLDRVIISGGDTSGFVTKELGIYALEIIKSVSPGAPLCEAFSTDESFNGLEIALKGGQLGGENYYSNVLSIS